MKKRLLVSIIALIGLLSEVNSQTTTKSDKIQAEKDLLPPLRDTMFVPARLGELTTRPQDTSIYQGISLIPGTKKWDKLTRFSQLSGLGGGSVLSVGLITPVGETVVSGSPVTGVGNLVWDWTPKAPKLVFASDPILTIKPSFRALDTGYISNFTTIINNMIDSGNHYTPCSPIATKIDTNKIKICSCPYNICDTIIVSGGIESFYFLNDSTIIVCHLPITTCDTIPPTPPLNPDSIICTTTQVCDTISLNNPITTWIFQNGLKQISPRVIEQGGYFNRNTEIDGRNQYSITYDSVNFYMRGALGTGQRITPFTGPQFIWSPRKAAARFGVETHNYWVDDSIGIFSFAAGANLSAIADYSAAVGGTSNYIRPGGTAAFIGGGNDHDIRASRGAILGGQGTYIPASGYTATVVGGLNNTPYSQYSLTSGIYAQNYTFGGTTLGTYPDSLDRTFIGAGKLSNIYNDGRIFQIGNGTGRGALRSNAMTVYNRNGQTVIGGVGLDSAAQLKLLNNNLAFKVNSGTTAQMNSVLLPYNGLLYWNDDSLALCEYTAGAWRKVDRSGGSGTPTYNANIGSGNRLVIPNTIDIKTLFGGGILVIDSTTNANALTLSATEIDGSVSNEIQTQSLSGTTTVTNTLSLSGGSWSITGAGIAAVSRSGTAITVTATEADGSISNELQTIANTSDATSHTATLSSSGGSIKLVEGSGITLATTGTGLDGIVTISATAGGGGTVTQVNTGYGNTGGPITGIGTIVFDSATVFPQLLNTIVMTNNAGSATWNPAIRTINIPAALTYYNSNIGSGFRLAIPNTNNIKTLFGSGIVTIDSISNANALTIIGTEIDGSVSNELQTQTLSGTTTITNTLSVNSSAVTYTGAGIVAVSRVGNAMTITGTEVDGSTSNEIQTISASGTTSPAIDLSLAGGSVTFNSGGIVALSRASNTITITATEVDGSTSNELQTIANTSDATSHTATLSNSGGSIKLVEGSGIGLVTTGTGLDGIITITATGGGGTVTQVNTGYGTTGGPITGIGTILFDSATVFQQLINTIALTTTGSGVSTWTPAIRTFNIPNNTFYNANIGSGFRLIVPNTINVKTIFGAGILVIDSTTNANALTFTVTEVDGSITNELQTIANTSDATTHTATLSNSGGSIQLIEGSGITLTTGGTGLNGSITIASTGGSTYYNSNIGSGYRLAIPNTNNIKTVFGSGIITIDSTTNANALTIIGTEVDGSVSNELQTISNTSNATSHTATLSNSGGSTQFVEGTDIALTTSGTGLNGIVTLATTITAINGLNRNANDIKLGGALVENTTISGSTSFATFFTGSYGTGVNNGVINITQSGTGGAAIYAVNNGSGGNAINAIASSTGTAISGTSTVGQAISGGASSGIGIYGTATSGTGVQSAVTSGIPAYFSADPSSTSTNTPLLQLQRTTSGTPANGISGSIDFIVETSSSISNISNQFISKWTTVDNSTRVSQAIITGVNNAVTADLLTISGNGATRLNKYGVGTFTGTPTYDIKSDASGNLIEVTDVAFNPKDTVQSYTGMRAYVGTGKELVNVDSRTGGTFYVVASGSENGSTLIVASDGRKWQRLFDGVTYKPEFFEIFGKDENGATYDRLTGTGIGSEAEAIDKICKVAGREATILYTPNKTYNIDRHIRMIQRQKHVGGIIKRATPVTTILVNNEAINSTTIEVTDASNLQAGMEFLIKGAGTTGDFNQNSGGSGGTDYHTITSISGNTLTISGSVNPIAKAMLAGDTVVSVAYLFLRENSILGASDTNFIAHYENMTFDGNSSANRYFTDYQQPATIGTFGGYFTADNCIFRNIPGENLYMAGGRIDNCFAQNLQGSFAHGTNNLQTLDSIYHEFIVTNLVADSIGLGDANKQGHSEASLLTGSTKTMNASFINCTVKYAGTINTTTKVKPLFNIMTADDGIVNVIGGHYERCAGIGAWRGIDSLTSKGKRMVIQDATFKNCNYLEISGTDLRKGNGFDGLKITGNKFVNARFYFADVSNLDFSNNEVTYDSLTYGGWKETLANGSTGTNWASQGQGAAFFLSAINDRVTIKNNSFSGFVNDSIATCILANLDNTIVTKDGASSTNYYYAQNYDISGNKFNGFRYTLSLGITSFTKATVGWTIDDNVVIMGKGSGYAADYTSGLRIPPGATANNNTVYNYYNTNYSYPFVAEGVSANQSSLVGATLTNNRTYGNAVHSIHISPFDNSPYNCIIKNNLRMSGAISGGALGLANSFKSGNDIMDATNLPALTAPATPFGHKVRENKSNY